MPDDQRATPLGRAIAKRVRLTRIARLLTQEQLTELAGLSHGMVSRIENQKRALSMSVEVLVRIALALHVDISWLITGIVPDGKWQPPTLDPRAKNFRDRPKR